MRQLPVARMERPRRPEWPPGPRQKQPLPTLDHEQQQRGSNTHCPYDRRCQSREITDDIGYAGDDEGGCKPIFREFEALRGHRLCAGRTFAHFRGRGNH